MLELSILVLSIIGNLVLSGLVYRANPRSRTNQLFVGFIVTTLLWLIANYYSYKTPNYTYALSAIRSVMFLASVQVFLLFMFVHTFPEPNIRLNRRLLLVFSLYTLAVMGLSFTPYIFSGLRSLDPVPSPIPGPAIPSFGLLAIGSLGSIIYLLVQKTRHAKGLLRQQLFYLSLGIIITFSLIALSNFILVLIGNTNFLILTPFYTLILASSVTYAILAHQLFDIRVIIRRTVVYSGLLLFTFGVYSMVVFLFTTLFQGRNAFTVTEFTVSLVGASFIAFGFEPLRRYLTDVTDNYLFKKGYNAQEVLTKLSHQLSDSVDINQAMQSLVTLIQSEMRLTHTAVITFAFDEKNVTIKHVIQSGYQSPDLLRLPPESALIQQSAREPKILINELIRRECAMRSPQDPTRQACEFLLVDLSRLETAVVLPILVKDRAIGVFLIGEKLSGDPIFREDIEFLTIVANQTANAIEKARFWEEDQMKSEFVSIASHELLTPTAAMKGYLSMILDENMGQVDDTARRFLTKVAQSADRLAILVEDLLNVSRIESGRLKVNKKNFPLTESVTRAVEELQMNAKKKSLDLAFVVPQTSLPNVYADPDHIYRVLVNLIGNAVKYTQKGWVRCFVTAFDANHILFAVSDSGLGIPKEAIPHLFEKFYRADRREIAGIQGTGLGLYISKRIVELMEGRMWVESEVGKGTTFYFTLPIATSQPTQLQPTNTPVENASNRI